MPSSLDDIRPPIFIPDVRSGNPGELFTGLLARRAPTDSQIFSLIAAQAAPSLPTFPVPSTPTPSGPLPGGGQVIPFPTQGPTGKALELLLRRSGGVIAAAFAVKDIARILEDQASEEQARIDEARVEAERVRIRTRRELERGEVGGGPVRTIPEAEAERIFEVIAVPNPAQIPRPDLPEIQTQPETTPDIPVVQPVPSPLPGIAVPAPPVPKPSKTPGAPQKRPKSPAQPRPGPLPGPGSTPGTGPGRRGIPRRAPLRRPAFFPVPLPIGSPSTFSVGQPSTNPTNLTRRRRTVQQSVTQQLGQIISAQPQPQPETNPDRCQEVKRRRRRKGRCKEGFFREFPGKTQFIEWREVDCATRSDISEFGGFLDAASGENVIEFPGS